MASELSLDPVGNGGDDLDPATDPQEDVDVDEDAPTVYTYAEMFPELKSSGAAAKPTLLSYAAGAVKSSVVTQVFHIPVTELKREKESRELFSEGRKWKECQDIMRDTSTTIDLSVGKDDSLSVAITGKRDTVQKAYRLLVQKLQTQGSLDVPVPIELHRAIIGKGGATLKALETDTATTIRVPRAEEGLAVVRVTGTAENCHRAELAIRAIVDKESKRDRVVLDVLRAYHPLIAGPGGATVKRIQELTGAQINIPPPAKDLDEIRIQGEKAAVAAAAAQVRAVYEEKRRTCGEVAIKVPKAQHKYVIGPRGTNLTDIMQRFGVYVEVPPAETQSDEVRLRGPQAGLVGALAAVQEKATSMVLRTVGAPAWTHRLLIGPRGANLRALTEGTPDVHLQFASDNDSIEVEGPPPQVAVAVATLTAKVADVVANMAVAELRVPARFHPRMIGKGGANIIKIRADTEAEITFPKPDSKGDPDLIRIEGAKASVAAAREQLAALAKMLENQRSVDVIVPQRLHSLIVGAGGSAIREFIAKFNGISVEIPPSKQQSDIIVIRGEKAAVEAAEKHLIKQSKTLEEENYTLEVPIIKAYHKNVIGKGGATLSKIRDETKTRITVPPENSDNDCITVVGRKADVEKARALLEKVQADTADFTVEELPMEARVQMLLRGAPAAAISAECNNVNIRFARDPAKSDKVLVRGSKADVAKAKGKLLKAAKDIAATIKTVTVAVRPEYHRHLVGRGGAALGKVQEESGAVVQLPAVKPKPKAKAAAEGADAAAADAPAAAAEAVDDTVTIFGTEAACAKAKELILARVKQLENMIEATTSIEPLYQKLMLQRSTLRAIQEDLSVNIALPRGEEAADVVKVKGPKDDVAQAIERLQAFVEDIKAQVTVEIAIPREYHGAVMGTKGANVNRISAEYNVAIKFPDRAGRPGKAPAAAAAAAASPTEAEPAADGEDAPAAAAAAAVTSPDTVKITGRKERCDAAAAALQELVPITATVDVDPALHAGIIGRGGDGLRRLTQDTNVQINVPAAAKGTPTITVRGLAPEVDRVKEALALRVAELEAEQEARKLRSFRVQVLVDAKHIPAIIGRQGAEINALRDEHDVKIDLPKRGAADNVVIITGLQASAEAAAAKIQAKVAELEALSTEEVEVNPAVVSRVIGARSANIRDLEARYSVRITAPRDRASGLFVIAGDADSVEACRSDLLALEEEFLQDLAERSPKPVRRVAPTERDRDRAAEFRVEQAPWHTLGADAFPGLAPPKPAAASAAGGAWGKKR